MFDEYQELVVKHYQNVVGSSDASVYMKDPTPANIKRECLKVYGLRYRAETDKTTLIDFFGNPDKQGDFGDAINSFKTANFRPVQQFIQEPTRHSHARNIELLAWLTNYQPRPFRFDTFKPPTEVPPPSDPIQPTRATDITVDPVKRNWQELIKQYQKESALVLFGLGLVIVILMKIFPGKQCMYWAGDHYEAIDCDRQIFGVQSIALDTMKLNHFKKITKPDTMTTYSIGKVWYVKIGPRPECFTSDGTHPLDPSKALKSLTLGILRKYFGTQLPDSVLKKQ